MINLPGLEDDVARVIALSKGAFRDVLCLPDAVRTNPQFDLLVNRLFPDPAEALAMLGTVMREWEEYRVGPLAGDEFELDAFLEAFRDAPRQLMACIPLVEGVARMLSAVECQDHLLPELCRPISVTRLAGILSHLAEVHERAGKRADQLLTVHNWYLKVAARLDESQFRPILSGARLLSRASRWKPTARLCLAYEGVDDDDLLDESQGKIIGNSVRTGRQGWPAAAAEVIHPTPSSAQSDWDREFDQSAALLHDYFQAWQGAVAPELIGGFLAVLGDHAQVRHLTERHLGNRTVKATRDLFDWIPLSGPHIGGAGESVHEAMTKQRFVIHVSKAETVTIPTLLGSTFVARISQNAKHLLVGNLFRGGERTAAGLRVKQLTLRQIAPGMYAEAQLAELLRESAALVLHDVFFQRVPNLDAVWDELAQSEQLDIQVAQKMLIHEAFFYLRQLGVRSHREIDQVYRQWDQARRVEVEEAQASHLGRRSHEQRAAQLRAAAQAGLERLLRDCVTNIHAVLIGAT